MFPARRQWESARWAHSSRLTRGLAPEATLPARPSAGRAPTAAIRDSLLSGCFSARLLVIGMGSEDDNR